jgi:hypothetical protein
MNTMLECSILRSSTKQTQFGLAIFVGLIGGYLLVNMVLIGFKDKPFFGQYLPLAAILFFVLVLLQIMIWYRSKGTLTIHQLPNGEYAVDIRFPNGLALAQKGKWEVIPTYTKTYAKYGMYYKNLALALFCDDQPFCLLRHQLGGAHSAPAGFIEVGQLFNPAESEFWCKKVPVIFGMLRK